MATGTDDLEVEHNRKQQTLPLLDHGTDNRQRNSLVTKAFKNTANLANLLPTGTVLAFQLLSPILSNQGRCSVVLRSLTGALVALCGLSCMVLSFTDSFVDDHGVVRYVFATSKGMWVIDGSPPPPPERAATYRIKFIDFMHAFMALVVFGAVAFLDKNVVSCLYPAAPSYTAGIFTSLPVAAGVVIMSALFVCFPTVRHGIGFPVAPH